MFGEDIRDEVNYSEDQRRQLLLIMPESNDDLETTAHKMHDLADVERGDSLAIMTCHYLRTTGQESAAVDIARPRMTPAERMLFDYWRSNPELLPEVEPERDIKDITSSTGADVLALYRRQTLAMQRIWNNSAHTKGNVAWLYENLSFAIPLLNAVEKLIDTERDHVVQQVELAEMEQGEIQVAHKAVVVAMDNLNQIRCDVDTRSREINQHQEVLQAREQAIKSKVDSYKNQDGLNHEVKSRYYKGQRLVCPSTTLVVPLVNMFPMRSFSRVPIYLPTR